MFNYYRYIRYFVTALRWPFEHPRFPTKGVPPRGGAAGRCDASWLAAHRRGARRGTTARCFSTRAAAADAMSAASPWRWRLASKQLHTAWMLGMHGSAHPRCSSRVVGCLRCRRIGASAAIRMRSAYCSATSMLPWWARRGTRGLLAALRMCLNGVSARRSGSLRLERALRDVERACAAWGRLR